MRNLLKRTHVNLKWDSNSVIAGRRCFITCPSLFTSIIKQKEKPKYPCLHLQPSDWALRSCASCLRRRATVEGSWDPPASVRLPRPGSSALRERPLRGHSESLHLINILCEACVECSMHIIPFNNSWTRQALSSSLHRYMCFEVRKIKSLAQGHRGRWQSSALSPDPPDVQSRAVLLAMTGAPGLGQSWHVVGSADSFYWNSLVITPTFNSTNGLTTVPVKQRRWENSSSHSRPEECRSFHHSSSPKIFLP